MINKTLLAAAGGVFLCFPGRRIRISLIPTRSKIAKHKQICLGDTPEEYIEWMEASFPNRKPKPKE